MIRQVSADWTTERDPTISSERTEISVERPRPSAIDLEQRLRDVPRRAFNIASFLVDHVEGLRKDGYINKLRVFDVSNGSALVGQRSEEHTSELQSLMRISYAVFCLKKKKQNNYIIHIVHIYHNIYTHHLHETLNLTI